MEGGRPPQFWARYLCFRRDITGTLTEKLRRVLRDHPEPAELFKLPKLYAPVFRKPLELRRFRLHLAFSTGDAAETAVFHGWLCLLLNSLRPRAIRCKPEIALEPGFISRPQLSLDGDISLAAPAAVFLFRLISLSIREKRMFHV
jgi:hypothetical protein